MAAYTPDAHNIVGCKRFIHLFQSQYAKKQISNSNKDYKGAFLSDYLNRRYFDQTPKKKEKIIVFNPSKGYEKSASILSLIAEKREDIRIIPLQKFTIDEVITLLTYSMVYIDFGTHPGKDRIPREAAILGNVIIVGNEGSACYLRDVSIPNKYKFEYSEENIAHIANSIEYAIDNFEKCTTDFEKYRNHIRSEAEIFAKEVASIFAPI